MSQPPPIALPYESSPAVSYWPALRLGAIVWAAALVVRHGTYWTAFGVARANPTAVILAWGEAALSLLLISELLRRSVPSRAVRGIAIAFLATAAISFGVEVSQLRMPYMTDRVLRTGWVLATRVQQVAVPIALIIAVSHARNSRIE